MGLHGKTNKRITSKGVLPVYRVRKRMRGIWERKIKGDIGRKDEGEKYQVTEETEWEKSLI